MLKKVREQDLILQQETLAVSVPQQETLAVPVPQIVYPKGAPDPNLNFPMSNRSTVIDLVERKELRFLRKTHAVEYLLDHVETIYPSSLEHKYNKLLGLPYKFENR